MPMCIKAEGRQVYCSSSRPELRAFPAAPKRICGIPTKATARVDLRYSRSAIRKTQARNDRIVARWLWDRFVRHRMHFIGLAVIFMVMEALMLGAFSYLVQPMFDDVFIEGERGRVYLVALAMAAVFFGRGLARLCHKALMAWQAESATAELQTTLLAHLTRLDQGFSS